LGTPNCESGGCPSGTLEHSILAAIFQNGRRDHIFGYIYAGKSRRIIIFVSIPMFSGMRNAMEVVLIMYIPIFYHLTPYSRWLPSKFFKFPLFSNE
jgi:hypothetical protein